MITTLLRYMSIGLLVIASTSYCPAGKWEINNPETPDKRVAQGGSGPSEHGDFDYVRGGEHKGQREFIVEGFNFKTGEIDKDNFKRVRNPDYKGKATVDSYGHKIKGYTHTTQSKHPHKK
jgi:hypothetical protein